MDIKTIETQIFTAANNAEFNRAAVEIFNYQYRTNPVYNQYVNYLGISPDKVDTVQKIPFLPIQFFKTHTVLSGCGIEDCQECFTSSGTTGQNTSRHYVKDINIYYNSLEKGFAEFYGSPENYTILALLPSYLERKGSSLIVMAQRLMQLSGQEKEGFFLYDFAALQQRINQEIASGKKVLLIGVTFALLDFAEQYPQHYGNNVIIMETGGMKGRKKEIIREEVHQIRHDRTSIAGIFLRRGTLPRNIHYEDNNPRQHRPAILLARHHSRMHQCDRPCQHTFVQFYRNTGHRHPSPRRHIRSAWTQRPHRHPRLQPYVRRLKNPFFEKNFYIF